MKKYEVNGDDLLIDSKIVVNGIEEWLKELVANIHTCRRCNKKLTEENDEFNTEINRQIKEIKALKANERECSDLDSKFYELDSKYRAALLLLKDVL